MSGTAKWGRGRIAVIALRDTIRAEIEAGHPLTDIYQRHEAALGVRYVHFTRLVRKLVTGRPPNPPTPATPSSSGAPPREQHRDDADGKRFRHKSDPTAPVLWQRVEPTDPKSKP